MVTPAPGRLRAPHETPRTHLHDVVSRFDVCDVKPLAVNVVAVQVPATDRDALVAEVGTLVSFRNT